MVFFTESTPLHVPETQTTISPVSMLTCSRPLGVHAPVGVVLPTSAPAPGAPASPLSPLSPFGPLSDAPIGDHVPPVRWYTMPVFTSTQLSPSLPSVPAGGVVPVRNDEPATPASPL